MTRKEPKNKSSHWSRFSTWDEAEFAWDTRQKSLSEKNPIRSLKKLPQMPGITKDTKKFLRLKGLKYILEKKQGKALRKWALKHPFKHGINYLRSIFRKKSYTKKEEDFYYYGFKSLEEFEKRVNHEKSLLILGFSYCHKPMECPSKRFTEDCIHDPEHPVCGQCFIGKSIHARKENKVLPLIIPTAFYIGEKVFEVKAANPKKEILFLITACEMTLEMFGDWGSLAGVKGIGVRLDGRICNTWKAFELSEEGIKPGLTVVLPKTQKRILEILKNTK